MKLKIFATGGTFDKIYNEADGKLIFKETHLKNMLSSANSKVDIEIETIMLIDSLDMKEHHHQEILDKCSSCAEDRIVITHGTDTMVDTAKLLGEKIKDKTIVLTGAMIPYSFLKWAPNLILGCQMFLAQTFHRKV